MQIQHPLWAELAVQAQLRLPPGLVGQCPSRPALLGHLDGAAAGIASRGETDELLIEQGAHVARQC